VPKERFPGRRVTGVTHTGKLVFMQFNLGECNTEHRTELESSIYQTLARYGVQLFMLNVSPESIGFAVPRDQYPIVEDVLDGLVMPLGSGDSRVIYVFQLGIATPEVETQVDLLKSLGEVRKVHAKLTEGCTVVSLVGHEYMQQPGVFLNVMVALEKAEISVLQTSDSDYSLSVLVPEADTMRTVRTLHEKFELSKIE
jgi:aspartate kinase